MAMTPLSPRYRLPVAIGGAVAVAAAAIVPATMSLASSGSTPASRPANTHVASATKSQPAVTAGSRYLALGDSVPFGYREPDSKPGTPNYSKASSFVGFPEDVAANLHLKLANAACPGETTSSFLKKTAQSNGCTNPGPGSTAPSYRSQFPLHVKYTTSQAKFAVKFLKQHPNTRLVTLMIGANDGFVCQEQTSDGCVSELSTLLAKVKKNVKKILTLVRHKAHYKGQLVIVKYYSTDYSSGLATLESTDLNTALEQAGKNFNVRIANGFGQLKKGAKQAGGNTCTAQLLTQTPGASSPCGVHPSYAGQALLAQAVERVVKQ
jgi:lysophospholipase L1-like esterase